MILESFLSEVKLLNRTLADLQQAIASLADLLGSVNIKNIAPPPLKVVKPSEPPEGAGEEQLDLPASDSDMAALEAEADQQPEELNPEEAPPAATKKKKTRKKKKDSKVIQIRSLESCRDKLRELRTVSVDSGMNDTAANLSIYNVLKKFSVDNSGKLPDVPEEKYPALYEYTEEQIGVFNVG